MRLSPSLLLLCAGTLPAAEPVLVPRPSLFPSLVNPKCSHCVDEAKRRADRLRPDDPVLCWTGGYSDGGAVPVRFFLTTHRVVSDSYGVFVHDPEAGYSRGFAPGYTFVFHGWRNGVMAMRDRSDGTLYSCLSGVAFDGPRKGHRLAPVPTTTSRWGAVMAHTPHAVTYQLLDKFPPAEAADVPNPDSVKSRPADPDPRLRPEELVLGVRIGDRVAAVPLSRLDRDGRTLEWDGRTLVVLSDRATDAGFAVFEPTARQPRKYLPPMPDANGVSPPNPGVPLPVGAAPLPPRPLTLVRRNADMVDRETGTVWNPFGRGASGPLKDWTLRPVDAVVCKWFAWSAEFPATAVLDAAPRAAAVEVAPPPKAVDANSRVKAVAGTAEFLRVLPKPFATLKAVDPRGRTVTLLIDGETVAKVWAVEPDAEIKVGGWWGRLEQLSPGARVWVWLKADRKKNPVSVAMLADAASEFDMHAGLRRNAVAPPEFAAPLLEARRGAQRTWLRERWTEEGLPGTLTFLHLFSGELEVMLDHEAMRWGRSLRPGDVVHLSADPPIKGVVKEVAPWRERTQVRLVVGELESSELKAGQRIHLRMPPPPAAVESSPYPPDLDRKRSAERRVEWFLASVYCTCGVSKDVCTGHFYTLASCNPNGCGMPDSTRDDLNGWIAKGKTDREIWDLLLKERGPLLLKPHLKP